MKVSTSTVKSTLVAKQNSIKESNGDYDEEFSELWDNNEFTKAELEISELFGNQHPQRHDSKKERERTS